MKEENVRTGLLIGEENVERLSGKRVAVFGVGGVGGYVVEALARTGIGSLDLIDSDTVSVSNINRQLIALHSTVGKSKVEAFRERIRDINPDCVCNAYNMFYLPSTRDQFDFTRYDYIVDAVDTVSAKLDLAEAAQAAGVPMISAMGAGNKLDPTRFQVADIYDTDVCPLSRVMRRECRKRGIKKLKVVYSKEEPRKVDNLEGGRKVAPGSIAFVPSVAGLIMASEVVKDLLK